MPLSVLGPTRTAAARAEVVGERPCESMLFRSRARRRSTAPPRTRAARADERRVEVSTADGIDTARRSAVTRPDSFLQDQRLERLGPGVPAPTTSRAPLQAAGRLPTETASPVTVPSLPGMARARGLPLPDSPRRRDRPRAARRRGSRAAPLPRRESRSRLPPRSVPARPPAKSRITMRMDGRGGEPRVACRRRGAASSSRVADHVAEEQGQLRGRVACAERNDRRRTSQRDERPFAR